MKTGRNTPCPCGSGKKYKKCCLNKGQQQKRKTQDAVIPKQKKTPLSRKFARHSLELPTTRPYVVAKMIDPKKNDPFWEQLSELTPLLNKFQHLPSKIRQLSTEMIIKQLEERHVHFDPTLFVEKCQEYDSAWDVSEAIWLKQTRSKSKDSADFCGLAACILWERFYEENKLNKLSFEMIDDLIEKGYEKNDTQSCDIWFSAWNGLKSQFDLSQLSFDQLENKFNGSQALLNWCQDFELKLLNVAIDNKDYAKKGISFFDEFFTFFSNGDEDLIPAFQRSQAEIYCHAGEYEKGEQIMSELLDRYPEDAGNYVGMDAVISLKPSVDKQSTLKQRLQILETAKNYPVTNGGDFDLNMRISDLKKKLQQY